MLWPYIYCFAKRQFGQIIRPGPDITTAAYCEIFGEDLPMLILKSGLLRDMLWALFRFLSDFDPPLVVIAVDNLFGDGFD
jgi:hypothetical protein